MFLHYEISKDIVSRFLVVVSYLFLETSRTLITIIVYDDKGRELNMSTGSESENKIYTQINELVDIGEIPKYIDILVCKNYGDEDNTLSSFRVNLE